MRRFIAALTEDAVQAVTRGVLAILLPTIRKEFRTMSDQVHTDIQALNTSLTSIASEASSISTELQNFKNAKPVGSTITDDDAALLHSLTARADSLNTSMQAMVQPDVAPTGTSSVSAASGTVTSGGTATDPTAVTNGGTEAPAT